MIVAKEELSKNFKHKRLSRANIAKRTIMIIIGAILAAIGL